MFYTGFWYQDFLMSAASETAGQWRVTRLPFGLYGQSGTSIAAISSQSVNKAEAWSVLEWIFQEHMSQFTQIVEETPLADPYRDYFF
jgi:multiple sugar transport system substrate-binding protein